MPKHKKTKEQKKKADAKISVTAYPSAQRIPTGIPSYTFSSQNYVAKPLHSPTITGTHEDLIRHDLLKTFIVSVSIVALQLLFYFLLRNHVLAINFVRY